MIANILPTFTSLITPPMLSPSWPKCVTQLAVAQLSVAQLVCRPDDRTPLEDSDDSDDDSNWSDDFDKIKN